MTALCLKQVLTDLDFLDQELQDCTKESVSLRARWHLYRAMALCVKLKLAVDASSS